MTYLRGSNYPQIAVTNVKVKLTTPLIALLLSRGQSQTQIAIACNVSGAAVSAYIKRHARDLAPLARAEDGLLAIQCKHIANKAQERILGHLDESEKKDLLALNAIAGTHIDKYRLLTDKSTANVSIHSKIEEASKLLSELESSFRDNSEDEG